jgi:N-acetyl-gamma-glutamyl-phosphate reductase/acetylglutamate kinase
LLALPNGARAPFVAALDEGAKTRGDGGSVAVDLSAEYRFDETGGGRSGSWVRTSVNTFRKSTSHAHRIVHKTYGRDTLRTAKRTSNPGCCATAVQTLLTLLFPRIVRGSMPTVFGVSGYPNTDTVTGLNDEAGRPTTLAKLTAEGQAGRAGLDRPG